MSREKKLIEKSTLYWKILQILSSENNTDNNKDEIDTEEDDHLSESDHDTIIEFEENESNEDEYSDNYNNKHIFIGKDKIT